MFRWKIQLLGCLAVIGEQTTYTRFRTQKTAVLLAYLSFNLYGSHSRNQLIELLWPDDPYESGRHKLSVALSALRAQLEPVGIAPNSVLMADRASVRLNSQSISTDVEEFQQSLRDARQAINESLQIKHLRKAAELYRGPLLPGFYEDWILLEQRRVETAHTEALWRLSLLLEHSGEHAEALDIALQLVTLDPLREDVQRHIMRLYVRLGNPSEALRWFDNFRRMLSDEVGSAPSGEILKLYNEIRTLAPSEGSRAAGAERPATASAPETERQAHEEEQDIPAGNSPTGDTSQGDDEDPIGGAVPLNSRYYVARPVDAELYRAIRNRTTVVLVRGARQAGKSSLLARGVQWAREIGARVVYTDFQLLNAEQLRTSDVLLQSLGRSIAEQLELEEDPLNGWDPAAGANLSFRRFVRQVILSSPDQPLLWALDEVDRLFGYPFGSEVFALFRAWHNERAFDPRGPWSRLTLAIAYATESRLFITDPNQSPFNIGTHLALEDFTSSQVAELNHRYGRPLRNDRELSQFIALLGGHPYLVRRGFQTLAQERISLGTLDAQADWDGWIFGDHLRRIRLLLQQNPDLSAAVQNFLRGRRDLSGDCFYRLRAAGVFAGEVPQEAQLRCGLYLRYFDRHLKESAG